MEVYRNLTPKKGVTLVLGFFDGVHKAHQNLFKKALETNCKTAAITFLEAPPVVLFKKQAQYIETAEKRIEHIEKEGIDYLYVLDFNDFKNMEAKDYVEKVIIDNFKPEYVVTGFNHTFGHNKTGNSALLKKYSDFKYIELPKVKYGDILISSTNIRSAIMEGDIDLANKMLNRNFSIQGAVVKGNGLARKLGYKTANIIWNQNIVKPKYGVYLGFALFENQKYNALINFGLRPTADKNLNETLEVHLLGFEGDLYGKSLEVYFNSRIRDEIKFSSLGELKKQIEKDYNIATMQKNTNAE